MENRVRAAHGADGGQLVDPLRLGHEGRQRLERAAEERHVEAGDDDMQPARGQVPDHALEWGSEELRLVDRHDVEVFGIDRGDDLLG